jgi:hypothetical protein
MIKQKELYRGWSALKSKLEEKGLSQHELEESEASFQRGIQALSQLFLLNRNNKSDFKNN